MAKKRRRLPRCQKLDFSHRKSGLPLASSSKLPHIRQPTKQKQVHKQGIKLPLYKNRSPPPTWRFCSLWGRKQWLCHELGRFWSLWINTQMPGDIVWRVQSPHRFLFYFLRSHKCCQEAGSFKFGAAVILLVCFSIFLFVCLCICFFTFFFFFLNLTQNKVTKKKVQVIVWSLSSSVLEMIKEQICQYRFLNIYTCTFEQNIVLCQSHSRGSLRSHGEITSVFSFMA